MSEKLEVWQGPINRILALGIKSNLAIVIRFETVGFPCDFRIFIAAVVKLNLSSAFRIMAYCPAGLASFANGSARFGSCSFREVFWSWPIRSRSTNSSRRELIATGSCANSSVATNVKNSAVAKKRKRFARIARRSGAAEETGIGSCLDLACEDVNAFFATPIFHTSRLLSVFSVPACVIKVEVSGHAAQDRKDLGDNACVGREKKSLKLSTYLYYDGELGR